MLALTWRTVPLLEVLSYVLAVAAFVQAMR